MSHTESASSHNPAPDVGPPTSTDAAIIENLHRILGKKRTEIRDLKEQLATVRELREDDLRTIMKLRERVEQLTDPEEK
jgi:hypothetical protein